MDQPSSHRVQSSSDAALQKRWQETVSRLVFLEGCNRLFLDHVKMRLESRFLGPGVELFNEGDEGDELFVLLRGSAESLGGESFTDGAVLGDPVVLLRAGEHRTTSVRTTDYCDLQVICRRAFQEAAAMFPGEARRVTSRVAPKVPPSPAFSSRKSISRGSTPRASTPLTPTPKKRNTRMSLAFTDMSTDASSPSPSSFNSSRSKRGSVHPHKHRHSVAVKMVDSSPTEGEVHARTRLSLKLSSLCSSTKLASMARKCMLGSVAEGEGTDTQQRLTRGTSAMPGWAYTALEEDEAARRELAAWLDTIHFFANMDAFCFERLLPLFERRRFKEGEKILVEGAVTEAIHVLYAGDAHVIVNGVKINTVGPGSIVGARTMLASGVQQSKGTASIVASSSIVSTVALPRNLLYGLFRGTPLMHQQLEDLWNNETGKQDLGERTIYDTWLFRGCDPQFAKLLENTIEQRFIAPGTPIITEGEVSTDAYLIVLGTVNILIKGKQVDTVVVDDYCGATLFGELALLGISPARSASVIAATAVRVQVLCAEPLRRAFDQHPDASVIFRRVAEDRMEKDHRRAMPVESPSEKHCGGHSPYDNPSSEKKAWLPLTPATPATSDEMVRSLSRAAESRKSLAALGEQLIVSCDLGTTKHMCNCSGSFLDALSMLLSERLYMPQQVLMREGEEMDEVFVLQKGQCSVSWRGEELATIEGPCMIGSMMALVSPTVVTTVVADVTCWVAVVSKKDFAGVLDCHPEDRKVLLGLAHDSFSELCEGFDDTVDNHLETSLTSLPALHGASSGFLSVLTTVVTTRLVLPGTVIAKEHARDDESAKLYILFEGYCHFLKDGTVVSTLRGGTIFGEMAVFGLPDEGTRNVQVRAVELCKLGTVDRPQFLDALARFPDERGRFERIVHGRLEDTVHATVARLPCFEGLQNQFVSKLRLCLARRLVQEGQVLIREGDAGDSMFVVNCGKMEITYSGIVVGMLWPGKAFGAPQLLGVTREYHATLRAKKTCHVLAFSRSALSAMVLGPAERQWKTSWEHRAQAAYESELQAFKRKCREQRCMARVGQQMGATMGGVGDVLLRNIFAAWRKTVGRQKRGSIVAPRTAIGTKAKPSRQTLPLSIPGQVQPEVLQMTEPMMFSRRLKRVALESHGHGTDLDPLHWARDGRMDCWKGASTPRWLTATRDEIGRQLVVHKANARGEPPLGLSRLTACSG